MRPGTRLRAPIPLGGEAGNTIYDPGSGWILVAVQTRNEVVAIDPATERVVRRYPLAHAEHPHGLSVDPARRLLFVANEGDATLLTVDLLAAVEYISDGPSERPDVSASTRGGGVSTWQRSRVW